MRNYSDLAYILRKNKFGEADILLTIFSKKYGKKKILVRGSQKIASKFLGHAEPFSLVKISFVGGKSFDVATTLEIKKSFHDIKEDIRNLPEISYIFEVIEALTVDEDPHKEIYDLLEAVTGSSLWKKNKDFMVTMFLVSVIKFTGFSPQLDSCAKCGKINNEALSFSNYWGGITCKECFSSNNSVKLNDMIKNELRKRFYAANLFLKSKKHGNMVKGMDMGADKDIKTILDNFINYINERKTNSSKYFKNNVS